MAVILLLFALFYDMGIDGLKKDPFARVTNEGIFMQIILYCKQKLCPLMHFLNDQYFHLCSKNYLFKLKIIYLKGFRASEFCAIIL